MKKIIILIFLLLFISFSISIYTKPEEIDLCLAGTFFILEDESYQEPVEVCIKGQYYNNIISGKKFDGTIHLNNYNYRGIEYFDNQLLSNIPIEFDRYNRGYLSPSSPFAHLYGTMYIDDDFSSFFIRVGGRREPKNNENKISYNNLCLSAPASNRDEAVSIYEEIWKFVVEQSEENEKMQ